MSNATKMPLKSCLRQNQAGDEMRLKKKVSFQGMEQKPNQGRVQSAYVPEVNPYKWVNPRAGQSTYVPEVNPYKWVNPGAGQSTYRPEVNPYKWVNPNLIPTQTTQLGHTEHKGQGDITIPKRLTQQPGQLQVQTLDEADQKIAALEKKKSKILSVMERTENFKSQLRKVHEELALKQQTLEMKEKMAAVASRTVEQLEADMQAETWRRAEAEAELSKQNQAVETLKAALDATQKAQDETLQWEEERSRLVEEHNLETSALQATVAQVQEEMERERSEMLEAKSELLKSISATENALAECKRQQEKSRSEFYERMSALEEAMLAKEQSKRLSRWGRIKRFFTRT